MLKNIVSRVMLIIILALLSLFLPIYHHFSILQIIYGTMGNISLFTLLLLIALIINFIIFNKISISIDYRVDLIFIILGLLLYSSALGFIKIDIYAYGYYPNRSLLLLMIIWCVVLLKLNPLYSWIILFAIIGFYFRIMASNNLWDYLIDPILWIMSIVNLVNKYIKH